jgi:hypothetical protein
MRKKGINPKGVEILASILPISDKYPKNNIVQFNMKIVPSTSVFFSTAEYKSGNSSF